MARYRTVRLCHSVRDVATVVIGGLVPATLLTLFVLPTLHIRFGGMKSVEGYGRWEPG